MGEKQDGLDKIIQEAVENLNRQNEVELVSLRHNYDSEFEDLKGRYRRYMRWFLLLWAVALFFLMALVYVRARKYGEAIDGQVAESARWTQRLHLLQEDVRLEVRALKKQEEVLRKILEGGNGNHPAPEKKQGEESAEPGAAEAETAPPAIGGGSEK